MTPHQLRLTAFGPFAGTVSVDLDALASSGLFLLHGATGAGKTTLLDGLGFALFGRVPGVRNGAKRLRSDLAPADARTEVRLEATLGGRRLRITRSPQWERPKTRGTGTTTQQASVLLEERVGDRWECLSTRVGEADQEIADLVGMSAEQFFQVVLLPQGDFAQFLRSTSADRAEVLKKLFATERFADVEGWLAGRRRTSAEQVAAQRDVAALTVSCLAEVAVCEPPAHADNAWAAGLLVAATAATTTCDELVAAATERRDSARRLADAAVQLAGWQRRRAEALEREQALAQGLAERLRRQQELDAAGRAAEVSAVLAAVVARRRAREEALVTCGAARSDLLQLDLDPDLAVAGLRAAVAKAQELSGRFEALTAVETARRAAGDEQSQAVEEQADALAACAAAELELATLPARKLQLADRLVAAREAATTAPTVRADRTQLAELRPDVVSLAQVRTRLAQLGQEHLSARETALALEIKANDLRVASINSMIAVLAFRLEDGVPCDVCGSSVHPDPSQLRDEGVSSDDEERARRLADQAQEEVGRLQELIAADSARATSLDARVADWTLTTVDAAIAALDLELDVLVAVAAQTTVVEREAADLEALMARLGQAQVAASTRADAAQRRATDAGKRAATAATELTSALGAYPSVQDALLGQAAVVEAASRALNASEALATAQHELDAAEGEGDSACRQAGFDGAEQALEAARTAQWRTETAAELRAAADLAAAVAADLADPALDVPLDPPAPVAATAGAVAAADAALAAALSELGECRHRQVALQRLVPTLARVLQELAPLEQKASEIRGLADLCAGGGVNGLKMTLTSFVLAARLEEVAAAASVRLLRMTQGRYSLVHTDGAARGGQRSGLGLLARDGWTGNDRDTSTLSGGETFLASLALALGLADVVTSEAGGARIGALFVDEGFGTLDEDSLDEVMDVLDGLREGGRIVGLVSHVSELRQRIPAQVGVRKTRAGSDLVLHGC